MARDVQDHYFRQAKREGYRARAAYKLTEIDDRRKILRKGDRVLDCGAAPGAWLQVAARRVGPKGVVVGIDLTPIKGNFRETNIHTIEGDLTTIDANDLLNPTGSDKPFDVVLSDMAPKTTGDRAIDHHQSVRLCHAVLDRCGELLRPGGRLVMKVFEGEAYRDLLDRTGQLFEHVKGFSPKASRHESTEIYIIATGFQPSRPEGSSPTPDADTADPPH